jgi:single-strand DNA-binding protein
MNETWVTICGNVVDEPRFRVTASGMVASFRVASTPSWTREGEWSDGPTSFYDINCWNRIAENVAECVAKGQPVLVHGRLSVRDWVTETGRGRSVEVKADHVGHDLRFGTAVFQRVARVREPQADVSSEQEFESVAELTPAPDGSTEVAA